MLQTALKTALKTALWVQEDVFVPTLSARETLQFAAKLRLETGTPVAQREARIDNVLHVMGLWRCQHTEVCKGCLRLAVLSAPQLNVCKTAL